MTAWQGATGHRRDRAEVHQGKPADADGEQADAAALVAVVDQADADGETGDAGRSQFGNG